MSEPTQEQRDEAKRITYCGDELLELMALIQQRDALQDKLSDALALAAEVALGVTHSTICSKETPCVRCDRDALKAKLDAVKGCHCCDKALEWEHEEDFPGFLKCTQCDANDCKRLEKEMNRVEALKAELAVVKRDHGQAILRGQAEREAKEEAQRKLEGLAEAQRQLNCDRDVELTNLRARVCQLQEQVARLLSKTDGDLQTIGNLTERLARVERERDQYRVLANMAECEMQQARARVSKLEGALRAYREWTDHLNGCIVLTEPTYACDCGLDPLIDQADEALLAPANREGLEYERLSTGDWAIKDPANRDACRACGKNPCVWTHAACRGGDDAR